MSNKDELLKRPTPTPTCQSQLNGYQYSFRNSLEQPMEHPQRDPALDKLRDTPKFSGKGHFVFPEEPPRRRPVSAFKKQSVQSFGRRSKSHMQLVPLSRNNTRIGKIQINYNTFDVYTPTRRQLNLSTRSASTRSGFRKPQTTEQIYMEKLRTPTKSTAMLQQLVPPTPDRLVLASRIPTMKRTSQQPQAKEFNRMYLMQKRLRNERRLNDSSGRM